MENINNIILYLDCDGVILNTIDKAYEIMQEEGLDINDWRIVNRFFINTDWNMLIEKAGVIKDAINKIKKIIELNLFKEVAILTKTSGNLCEEGIKREFFGEVLPGVRVITVDFYANKDEVVNPVNNILVEDSIKNAVRWNNAGGIGVLFVKGKPDYEKDEIDDLADLCETGSVKRLLRTRNI